jgi:hypothetical protein
LPKRNYGFEKRQKELNKQRKREEKQQRKLDRSSGRGPDGLPLEGETPTDEAAGQEGAS